MADLRLEPIQAGSRGALVADAVRAAIYSGRFQPGEAIREMQLARELQVSQTTVREALLQLEHAGLVVREANRCTRVTQLSEEEIREYIAVRLLLETSAAAEAARRMTPAQIAGLETHLHEIASAVRRNDYFEAAQADLGFHRAIWRAAGNQMLFRLLDQLAAPLFAFVSMRQSSDVADLRRRVRSHEPIFEALRSGRAPAARKAIREHLTASYGQFLGQPVHSASPALGNP
jgi:DNA-binding GntR family transcriptional regulator